MASRLSSLGGRVTKRLKGALCLGVQKALGVVLTHYIVDLKQVATGYVIAPGADEDATVAGIEQADVAAESAASTLAALFEGDLLPDAKDDIAEGPRDREGDL